MKEKKENKSFVDVDNVAYCLVVFLLLFAQHFRQWQNEIHLQQGENEIYSMCVNLTEMKMIIKNYNGTLRHT